MTKNPVSCSIVPMPAKKTTKDTSFAVIATGGKQYEVRVGDTLKVEKLKGTFEKGDSVVFDKVLLTDDGSTTNIGMPYIAGAKVVGEFVKSGLGEKKIVFRYKAKSNRDKMKGHRQPYFEVKIKEIV